MDPALHEKIGVLTAKVEAAHNRIDDVEGDIKSSLESIHKDLKELNAHMHKGKGIAAVIYFVAGIAGAGVVKILSIIFSVKT